MPNRTITFSINTQIIGEAASLGYAIYAQDGTTLIARVAPGGGSGVTQRGSSSVYSVTRTDIDRAWEFYIAWDRNGTSLGSETFEASVVFGSPTNPASINLTQSISDVQTGTVGGALNGAWAVAWGKTMIDRVLRRLNVWGAGNSTLTQSYSFTLDDATRPSLRTPAGG